MQTSQYDVNSPNIVSALDDCWMWSFPFGAKILQEVEYKSNMIALDVGCGSGFPTIDLSQRLGQSCYTLGIDVWQPALQRARQKVDAWQFKNVEFVHTDAHQFCFKNDFFDLVISNNGINNVENDERVMHEIARICRSGAQLVLTVNLPETFLEFYSLLCQVLDDLDKPECLNAVHHHIFTLRKPVDYTRELITNAGFTIQSIYKNEFKWHFADSQAFFNHYFIKLAFLQAWRDCLDADAAEILNRVGERLDAASGQNPIVMTVPWICVNAKKI